MKKKIKVILIALLITVLLELIALVGFKAYQIINASLNQDVAEDTKDEKKDKNEDGKNNKSSASSSSLPATSSSVTGEPKLGPVDISYFDDALFLGDSRTVGLRAFGSFTNSSYFAKTGISVNSFFIYPALDEETGLTLTQTLLQRQYKKIYIMIGVNDAAIVPIEDFEAQFFDAIRQIQELQPNAVIYIQSILGVTKNKELGDPYHYSNAKVLERNELLKSRCDGKSLIYLDVFSVFSDYEGYLNSLYSNDGLHLNSSDYQAWCDYLLAHGLPIE